MTCFIETAYSQDEEPSNCSLQIKSITEGWRGAGLCNSAEGLSCPSSVVVASARGTEARP